MTSRRRPSATRNLGFSMIEILVALLLISVGFMNIAGLQTAAKKANYASLQRTTAAILGRDVAEKMRANPVALGGYITAAGGVVVARSASPVRPVPRLLNVTRVSWPPTICGYGSRPSMVPMRAAPLTVLSPILEAWSIRRPVSPALPAGWPAFMSLLWCGEGSMS